MRSLLALLAVVCLADNVQAQDITVLEDAKEWCRKDLEKETVRNGGKLTYDQCVKKWVETATSNRSQFVENAKSHCESDPEKETKKNAGALELDECIKKWSNNFLYAGEYRGKFTLIDNNCDEDTNDGLLVITKSRATFYESDCKLSSVRQFGRKATWFRAKAMCESEGEKMKAEFIFDADSPGKLTVTDLPDKTKITYFRCWR